jgi:hypothetical protein
MFLSTNMSWHLTTPFPVASNAMVSARNNKGKNLAQGRLQVFPNGFCFGNGT